MTVEPASSEPAALARDVWDRPVPADFAARVVEESLSLWLADWQPGDPLPLQLLSDGERAQRRALIDASIDEDANAAIAAQATRDRAFIGADPARMDELDALLEPSVARWLVMTEAERKAKIEQERAATLARGGSIAHPGPWEIVEGEWRIETLSAQRRHEQAAQATRMERVTRLGGRVLSEISTDPPPPLICDRLDPGAHTILYGTGGIGKGTVATYWIVQMVRLGHRVVILDYENHPEEWARRYAGLTGSDGADRVLHLAPLSSRWQGERGPLWTQAEDLREVCIGFGATVIVIDSIVVACGGADPTEPGTPARYAGALEYIGLPALSLAHVTKDASLEYPFGSVFWHNLARVTWSLAKQDGKRAVLTNRKANNYARVGKFVIEMTWWEGRPREVAELDFTSSIAERIEDLLGDDALTDDDIVRGLNADLDEDDPKVKLDSVQTALRRGLKRVPPRFRLTDNKWRRAS